ncbi:Leucine-rich repeat transmembrane protein kinase [Rhynchospora pubera]|uniref:non-specific serine/threonine protein kinase n=1 Tax=Rhynchospora pubera TaxID=906938 RepID=A0AAV8D6F4_9POAL|nr:Leucine-rich repeat transmembrane protein kinase [Rhynchospora pubera]
MMMSSGSPLTRDFGVILIVCLLIVSGSGTASAQAKTAPSEVAALNTILGRWGKSANSHWNLSGEPCSGWAIDSTNVDNNPDFNPGIKCDCSYNSNTTCHIYKLRVYALDVVGTIPDELQNLTYLTNLDLGQNYLTGPLPAFIGNLSRMQYMTFGVNALSGPVPKELGNLGNLVSLGLGTNNFNGSIPDEFGNLTSLQQLYIDSSGLSGELPQSLSKLKNMKILGASDNAFTGKIPDYIGTWTGLTDLKFQGNSFQGPIPSSFSNLVRLTNLRIGEITNGSSTLNFISNMTSLSTLVLRNCEISDTLSIDFSKLKNLQLLDLSFNNITGGVPQSLFSLSSLRYLFLGNNTLSGSLPSQKSTSLLNIDLSYNQLSGAFPSWVGPNGNLQLNLVANNFNIQSSNSSVLPSGLECLQRDVPCYKGSPIYSSFAIRCGAARSLTAQDGTVYQSDNVNLSAASYYVTDATRWGVSNVGSFLDASSNNYIIGSLSQFQNTLDSELFQNSRMSPSSLRYYGLGLENGNYTVKLQFAEIAYPDPPPFGWKSTGRRVFDIFIQGALKEKDFDIRKEAGGSSFVAVVRNYTIPVTNNVIEIHFFWAGKGTCCVPSQGYYGPSISAISVSPFDFTPTVSNREPGVSKSKTGLIVGVIVGVTVLGLIAVLAILYWRHKKKMSDIDEDLLGIVDRPDVFSYAELRTATEAFNASNILGEGGYGPVYKGKLSDGRIVAVKQLAATSHQGKREFLTEIATISAVQHRNLVKLYGCCVEGNKPLLVYEYLEHGSLDQALFGKHTLYLDWATRFEICLGVARGLAYLHEESSVRIVHRDIKASNILLDGELNPKISDFGLAKLYDDKKTHISTRVAGTIGYLAPEYAMRGHLTEKTDVFAFGVVVLEAVAGRSNSDQTQRPDQIYLFEWAWNLYEQNRALELLDPKLTSYDKDQALRLIGISLSCTHASPLQRPSMSRVVSMLTGDSEVSKVTSRPSYLTDWQFKEMTNNNFTTEEFSGPTSQNSGTRGVQTSIPHSDSSLLLLDSIIQEGR